MLETLDLHGVPHEQVSDLVHQFVNCNWRPNLELIIITGHSVVMKELVYQVLKQYDIEIMTSDYRNHGQIRCQTWVE